MKADSGGDRSALPLVTLGVAILAPLSGCGLSMLCARWGYGSALLLVGLVGLLAVVLLTQAELSPRHIFTTLAAVAVQLFQLQLQVGPITLTPPLAFVGLCVLLVGYRASAVARRSPVGRLIILAILYNLLLVLTLFQSVDVKVSIIFVLASVCITLAFPAMIVSDIVGHSRKAASAWRAVGSVCRVALVAGVASTLLGLILAADGTSGYERFSGLAQDPNFYASMVAPLAPLGLCLLATDTSRLAQSLDALSLVVIVVGTVFSLSRGGLVALVVGVASFVVMLACVRGIWHALRWVAGLALYTLGVTMLARLFGGDSVAEDLHASLFRFQLLAATALGRPGYQLRDASYLARTAILQAGWELWRQRPVLGHGIGTFEGLLPTAIRTDLKYGAGDAHNTYLRLLVEAGMVGTGAFLLYLGASLGMIVRRFRRMSGSSVQMRILLAGLLASLMASLTTQIFLDHLFHWAFWLVFGLALSIVVATSTEEQSESGR